MASKISNKELADYLNEIFNHPYFKRTICSFGDKFVDIAYTDLGNIIAKYYISTQDSSLDSAFYLMRKYVEYKNSGLTTLVFIKDFFTKYLERKIAEYDRIKELTFSKRVEISESIADQNSINYFYTHCFPGAIDEIVESQGLDISRELFINEFTILNKCFFSPFKTGYLNYCDLSSASLSYATKGVPERVSFCLGGFSQERLPNETRRDYFIRCFKDNLNKAMRDGKINDNDYQLMYQAGLKIINFYSKNDNVCIAVFREEREKIPTKANHTKYFIEKLNYLFKGEPRLFNSPLQKDLERILASALANPSESLLIVEEGLKKLSSIDPLIKNYIDTFLNEIFAERCVLDVKNITTGGYADGYVANDGKKARSEFEVVRFELPSETVRHTKVTVNDSVNVVLPLSSKDCLAKLKSEQEVLDNIAALSTPPIKALKIEITSNKYVSVAVYSDHIGIIDAKAQTIEDGDIVFTAITEKALINNCINALVRDLETLPLTEQEKSVQLYKKSNEYDADYYADENNLEYLINDALQYQATRIFHDMDEESKHELEQRILTLFNRISLNINDGTCTAISPSGEVRECKITTVFDTAYPESLNYFNYIRNHKLANKKVDVTNVSYSAVKVNQKNI